MLSLGVNGVFDHKDRRIECVDQRLHQPLPFGKGTESCLVACEGMDTVVQQLACIEHGISHVVRARVDGKNPGGTLLNCCQLCHGDKITHMDKIELVGLV